MTGSGLSLRQERVLAITPKCTSAISIPCSIFVIYEVYSDYRTKGTTPVQRALVGMSCVDILASSAWFISTWAVPKGAWALSAGNRATCDFQGFLLQLAVGAPLYNSSLALFYLLIIKQRWSNEQLAQIEKWVHGFILTFSIGTSFLLLPLKQYNHIGAVCWVIGDPQECGNSSYNSSDIPCERGNHAYLWGVLLFYGPLWVCVLACICCMAVIVLEVRRVHKRARRYTTVLGARHSMNRSGNDTTRVATQALLYSLSFIFTWMPSTLWSIAHWFNWSHYGLDVATAATEPLQGFWNLLIFLKSRPATLAKIRKKLATIFPCCISAPNEEEEFRKSFASGLRQKISSLNLSVHLSAFLTEQPDSSKATSNIDPADKKNGLEEQKDRHDIDAIDEETPGSQSGDGASTESHYKLGFGMGKSPSRRCSGTEPVADERDTRCCDTAETFAVVNHNESSELNRVQAQKRKAQLNCDVDFSRLSLSDSEEEKNVGPFDVEVQHDSIRASTSDRSDDVVSSQKAAVVAAFGDPDCRGELEAPVDGSTGISPANQHGQEKYEEQSAFDMDASGTISV